MEVCAVLHIYMIYMIYTVYMIYILLKLPCEYALCVCASDKQRTLKLMCMHEYMGLRAHTHTHRVWEEIKRRYPQLSQQSVASLETRIPIK